MAASLQLHGAALATTMPSSTVRQIQARAALRFSFGLAADVQYANKDTEVSGSGAIRRYRESLGKLEQAVREWKTFAGTEMPLSFVLHLGDIIDGNVSPEVTQQDFESVAAVFDTVGPLPVYHVLGNHCLACPREMVVARLGSLSSNGCYYSRGLGHGWRLLVLDTTEMSFHSGYGPGTELGREAQQFYDQHPQGEENPQIAPWNGGLGSAQMRWLREELQQASSSSESVIVAAHHPIASARETHRAWNAKAIEELLQEHECVKVVLTGHDHRGGYAVRGGIHFLTLEGMVEAPADSNAFAVVHVFEDAIEVHGRGVVPNRVLECIPAVKDDP
mmetsp:Transcript_33367/g.94533  ORF Transcript_33367/g.94533 Transcript_33367/m.94533 type:complete len:333 (+) Transcript_33367:105-1103(+)